MRLINNKLLLVVVVLLREEKAKHSRFAFFRRAKTSANSERGAPDTSDRTRRLPGWACLVSSASRLLYACRRSPEKCEQIKPVLQQIKERTFDWDQLPKISPAHGCKEPFKIDKVGNFTSDFLKTNEDTASKVAEFYRRLYCEGHVPASEIAK